MLVGEFSPLADINIQVVENVETKQHAENP